MITDGLKNIDILLYMVVTGPFFSDYKSQKIFLELGKRKIEDKNGVVK